MAYTLNELDLFRQRVLRINGTWRIETYNKDTGAVVDAIDFTGSDSSDPTSLLADVGRRRLVELAVYGQGGPTSLQSLVSGYGNVVAVGLIAQSIERGQVDPTEAIGGVLSRNAYPQAFASLKNPSLRYPIVPANSKFGGMLFKMNDDLVDAGYAPVIINSAVGSLSMIRDAAGQVQTRANLTAYRQARPAEGSGDNGYAGDLMVVQGRVFLCTTGVKAYARYAGNGVNLGGATKIDYITTVGANQTAAAEPAGLATAAVGDVIVDGTVSWTCLSITTNYNGYSYSAGLVLGEVRYGFDPFGLCQQLMLDLGRVNARHRVAILQNGQSDVGNANLTYQQALESVAGYFLQRGVKVAIGLSCYQPAAGTTAYNNLTTRVNGAISNLRISANAGVYYAVTDVMDGANLYTLMGSTGPMAAGGAYFAKDAGQDNIHLNAPGSIVGGGHMAAALIAGLAAAA